MSPKPIPLKNGYNVEFDSVDKHEWYNVIDQFSDSNIYPAKYFLLLHEISSILDKFFMITDDKVSLMRQSTVGYSRILLDVIFITGTRLLDRPNYSTHIFTSDIENDFQDFSDHSD